MSITDELREYANRYKNSHDAWSGIGDELTAIADRIDAEHERVRAESIIDMTDESMAEHGWIRLPLGEDGEPIRIGELVDERLPFGGYAKPAPVDGMELYRYTNGYGWMVKLDAENRALISPKLLRHHHAPAVVDVLREFAEKVIDSQIPGVHPTYEESIAEYAAKLRLAGDGE